MGGGKKEGRAANSKSLFLRASRFSSTSIVLTRPELRIALRKKAGMIKKMSKKRVKVHDLETIACILAYQNHHSSQGFISYYSHVCRQHLSCDFFKQFQGRAQASWPGPNENP